MTAYGPRPVANQFIVMATTDSRPVDPMKLQKLVYIAEGRSLADRGSSLVNERFQAWVWGPVLPTLYHDVRHFGRDFIRHPIFSIGVDKEWVPRVPTEDAEVIALLAAVWKRFGHYEAGHLSELTHLRGSPWRETREEAGLADDEWSDIKIDSEKIRRYFINNFKF